MTNQNLKLRNPEKHIIILFLSIIFLCWGAAYAQEANKSTITIKVAGLKTDDGEVRIDVFNNEEGWLKKSVYSSTAKILDNKCECTLENIPYGDYAVFVYQDKNSSGGMDMNKQGIPLEPFGYSKVIQMIMGPARWSDAKIEINKPSMEVPVKLMELQFGN